MEIHFYKYQGTGNDFVLLDNRESIYDNLSNEAIGQLCHRRFGIGADGLMLLNKIEGYDFEMKYYNSDGKPGSMCGNGGRCIVKFAFHLGIIQKTCRFLASDGLHEATIDETGWVALKMSDVDKIEARGKDYFLNTGSPHYVKNIEDLKEYPVFTEGKAIRYNNEFKAVGTNVNFVEKDSNTQQLFVRTYERGVEDETYSCGTGVTAAALVHATNAIGQNEIAIRTLGGELQVNFIREENGSFHSIYLCGPAEKVFEGQVNL